MTDRLPARSRRAVPGLRALALAVAGLAAATPQASSVDGTAFVDAQNHFYNARYKAAAASSLESRAIEPANLASYELRTSAILFQLKALLEGPNGRDADRKEAAKKQAVSACAPCPELIAAFLDDFQHGQALARAALHASPGDETALFFLGKLDLNYVWLQLGPLGRRTGWDEYWEARHSLDAVLKHNPRHVRAVVARAWIDYIVDTKMPWGTGWLLGGGNKKRALAAVRGATQSEADYFSHTEAEFALWNMLVRERDAPQATIVAQRLAVVFPDNLEVAAFLQTRDASTRK